ncbi:hypothetical protein [Oceanobacillus damuensis]|uniref:hypothetical protein n=1 Tax=Oceanobacillus damuensis TaxID=937928 RepID=UPI00082FEFC5|nr:hypothetical protein [Oceanobacillus damuensis]
MTNIQTALKMRGFFISKENGYLKLGKGSHSRDEVELKEMLEKLNIQATFSDNKIMITSEHIDNQKYEKILWYPAKNHEAGGNGGWRSWKYFSKGMYGPKIRTISLETGVALFVKALSAAGVRTISSCDGHGKKTPVVTFFGHYNACWFMVLKQHFIQDMKLNYDWKLMKWNNVDPDLIAESQTGKWELQLVLKDTHQMAEFLLKNGKGISELKRELFEANRNSTRKLVKEMNKEELISWMEQKLLERIRVKGGL